MRNLLILKASMLQNNVMQQKGRIQEKSIQKIGQVLSVSAFDIIYRPL